AKPGMPCLLLNPELRGAHPAAGEMCPSVFKTQCADHAVTIEPVTVLERAARESRRPIQVIGPADEIGNLALDLLNEVRLLARRLGEDALDQWSVVIHQSAPFPAPAAMCSPMPTRARAANRRST